MIIKKLTVTTIQLSDSKPNQIRINGSYVHSGQRDWERAIKTIFKTPKEQALKFHQQKPEWLQPN